jgi:hypothetical protein
VTAEAGVGDTLLRVRKPAANAIATPTLTILLRRIIAPCSPPDQVRPDETTIMADRAPKSIGASPDLVRLVEI